MKDFDVESVQRHRIRLASGEKCYITIGDRSMMAHRRNESAWENAVEYTGLNAVMRLSSKLRSCGYSWPDIAYQIESAGVGHPTVYGEVVRVIHRYIESGQPINRDWVEPGYEKENATP